MKKTVLLFLSVALSVLLLTACGQKTNIAATKTENPTEKSTETPETPETDEKPTETTETTGKSTETPETDGKTSGDDGKEMYVYIGENRLKVDLASNSSADALVGLLRKGDVRYTASDHGNFEKVGDIGYTLPRNDTKIAVSPGDVILYQGKSLCLYYGNNTYTFTKIGKINGYSESERKTLLYAGQGTKEVRLSLR